MKITREVYLLRVGDFANSRDFEIILADIRSSIKSVTHFSSTEFIINPTRKGNGVKPIKNSFVSTLGEFGWEGEKRMSLVDGVNPGPIDSIKSLKDGIFAVEWETGNMSSSHRALNKIATGIIQHNLIGGVLVLPERELAKFLTDRIGNYEELMPYFPMYSNLRISEGVIGVISVSHDSTSEEAPLIPKGTDGNSKLGQ